MRPIPLLLILSAALPLAAADTVRLPCTDDTSIVLLAGEERDHHGGDPHIRIKGNQHLAALAFDVTALKNRPIAAAELHCHRGAESIRAVTIATIQCPWDETAACGASAGLPGCDGWGVPGAWFPTVTQANGNALICGATPDRSTDPDWYVWPVDPDLVAALATGTAYGLSVQEVDADYSRNPTVSAREQSGQAPFLLVTLADPAAAPAAPTPAELTAPAATATGADPADLAVAVTAPNLAFTWRVTVDGHDLPRWNIPFVPPLPTHWDACCGHGPPYDHLQRIPLRDLPLTPGATIAVALTAIDRQGHAGPARLLHVVVPSDPIPAFPAPTADPAPLPAPPAGFAILPWLDKYRTDGQAVGTLPTDFRARNEAWDGQHIRLAAARGEVVGFQLLLPAPATVAVAIPGCTATVARALNVDTPHGRVPDPLVPPDATAPATAGEPTSYQVEAFVPFENLPAGPIAGTLTITTAITHPTVVPIALTVRGFALPRRAGFACECNGYGMPDALATFYDLQRIAYDHRAYANILHYSHRTAAPGARKCNLDLVLPDGRRMDETRYNAIKPGDEHAWWDDFATAFGPYLSGDCFQDGHRGAIPAPGFYLTFHESWPLNVRAFCDPHDPDAWTTFNAHPEYAKTWRAILTDFVDLARSHHWTDTGFQVFLNNKGAADDPTRAPWVLDEPAAWWDYRALSFFATQTALVQSHVVDAPTDSVPRIDFRADISRPEFARGTLGLTTLQVVATDAFQRYHRLVLDAARADHRRLFIYGGTNRVEDSDRDTWGWTVQAFRDGAEGVVPWQTIVTGDAPLTTGDELALYLIHDRDGRTVVDRSRRLDAYLRAEEDIEYLILLRDRYHLTPTALARFIDHYVDLGSHHDQADADDAGRSRYPHLTPDACWRLREAAALLLEARP